MRSAVTLPNFGAFADPHVVPGLAVVAEEAGWDAVFVWDHVARDVPADVADPWVLLTVAATRTSRVRLGPLVTPLARRRPEKVARETVTLDRLTGGRIVLGVGAGGGRPAGEAAEFRAFGDDSDLRARAARLDESLDVLAALWSGEEVHHTGAHLAVRGARFTPTPVQRPRIPVWVGGTWPRRGPLARAARWDAYVPDPGGAPPFTAGDVREMREALPPQVDLVVPGRTAPATAARHVGPLADAGATWWLEHPSPEEQSPEDVRSRLEAGPPLPA
jgi:alkanesulfonate monooxygenase SsuD/methylene tetrahydromethanopterin reductase-like flavin-dependent oxidoreductase (luciferase family)